MLLFALAPPTFLTLAAGMLLVGAWSVWQNR
jgi:hypothetical protein